MKKLQKIDASKFSKNEVFDLSKSEVKGGGGGLTNIWTDTTTGGADTGSNNTKDTGLLRDGGHR